jgi:hypothetical protein
MSTGYVSLRIPPDLLEIARERAELEDRSLSAIVRLAVRQYVTDDREPDQPRSA